VRNAGRGATVAVRMERSADRATTLKLAITAAVLGCGGLWIGRAATVDISYQMVDELVATDLSRWAGEELRVHGYVAERSIVDVWHRQPTKSFVLQWHGKQLRVVTTTPAPWTLHDQTELVARGHLVPASSVSIVDARCAARHAGGHPAEPCRVPSGAEQDYVLVASALMARCPSKYDGSATAACPRPSLVYR